VKPKVSITPILVSRCLLGVPCRYHGRPTAHHARIRRLEATGRYRLVPVCPEVDAGLPVPRPPTRRRGGRLVCGTEDVTEAFARGARLALATAQREGCAKAYLVRGSPSCDPDTGVTGELLRKHGLVVVKV
jgi:uncharacterized protein YbbK (DUF523 family)